MPEAAAPFTDADLPVDAVERGRSLNNQAVMLHLAGAATARGGLDWLGKTQYSDGMAGCCCREMKWAATRPCLIK
jgi:hypothetical protein